MKNLTKFQNVVLMTALLNLPLVILIVLLLIRALFS